MLQRIPTRPDLTGDEAETYICDTVMVLARLADDGRLPRLAARLRGILKAGVVGSDPGSI